MYAAPGAGNCTRCADPNAVATAADDGRGSSCACPLGWGQRFAPVAPVLYGQPTPAPVPICDECVQNLGPPLANVNGVSQYCTVCKGGWMQGVTRGGSTDATCTRCALGFYAPEGSDRCYPCPAGTTTLTLAGATQAFQCVPCPAGVSWSDGKGGPCKPCTAISCDMGLRVEGCTPTANAKCVKCDAGTVQVRRSQPFSVVTTHCPACFAGCYGNLSTGFDNQPCTNMVDTVCLCARGFSTNQSSSARLDALRCSACPQGHFSNGGPAPVKCLKCANGTYAPPGFGSCYDCADELGVAVADTPNDPGDGRTCTCPGGYSQAGRGATSQCAVCGAGRASLPGDASCTTCAAGSFVSAEDSLAGVQCALCPPGYFSGAGAGECLPCFPGSFAAFAGQPACDPCAVGTFQEWEAMTLCFPCPPGTTSPAGASNQTRQCLAPVPDPTFSPVPAMTRAYASASAEPNSLQVRGALLISPPAPVAAFASAQTVADLAAGVRAAVAAILLRGGSPDYGDLGMTVAVTGITDVATGVAVFRTASGWNRRRLLAVRGAAGTGAGAGDEGGDGDEGGGAGLLGTDADADADADAVADTVAGLAYDNGAAGSLGAGASPPPPQQPQRRRQRRLQIAGASGLKIDYVVQLWQNVSSARVQRAIRFAVSGALPDGTPGAGASFAALALEQTQAAAQASRNAQLLSGLTYATASIAAPSMDAPAPPPPETHAGSISLGFFGLLALVVAVAYLWLYELPRRRSARIAAEEAAIEAAQKAPPPPPPPPPIYWGSNLVPAAAPEDPRPPRHAHPIVLDGH